MVTDLGSKNGVFVNGVRYGGRKPAKPSVRLAPAGVLSARLRDADEVAVGDTRMRISLVEDEAFMDTQAADTPLRDGSWAPDESGPTEHEAGSCDTQLPGENLPGAPEVPGHRIVRELGQGGMGKVYLARDLRDGREVAIKTLRPGAAASELHIQAFLREVHISGQLKHPNIVEVMSSGQAQGTFFFVLEYVDGMDLGQLLLKRGGKLPLSEAAPLFMPILDALGHAHRARISAQLADRSTESFHGVVHRDLKPPNILLKRAASSWVPKVADFGLAKAFESAGLTDMTRTTQIAGTPAYWPREQITHYRFLCPATDVFSIAAVFYEVLCGAFVRDGFEELFSRSREHPTSVADFMRVIVNNRIVPIRRRAPEIPAPVAEVLDRALGEAEVHGDPGQMRSALSRLRYPDALAFQCELAAALKEAGVPAALGAETRVGYDGA